MVMGNHILEKISSPADVRKLDEDELQLLCADIRETLIETVSSNGGHLASNLGTVELTIALHKCFNSPHDSIIWDVGHQAYTHKLLTGRYEKFSTLRKAGGLSGFTRPDESSHDLFYSGHAGVAVSQAAGVAAANAINGSKNFAVAVIGDGSFAGGMVYEALDAAGSKHSNLIVVLNDNEMSISENVGSLAKHLARVRAKPEYYRFKAGTEKALNKIPVVGKSLSNHLFKLKTAIKNILYSSSFFEDLGFRYMGPIDGHDINALCEAMNSARLLGIPVLIHVNTIKGRGYDFAELEPEKFHGISDFNIETGDVESSDNNFSSVFGKYLTAFAEKDKRICAVTAAMSIGTGMECFQERFSDRFFDVGIAEEHAVTFCSGLAAAGLVPVFAVYSTFLQRCFDQLMHDASLQRRKMIVAVDRAGFVGSDGETHQGLYDVSMVSGIPGVTVYSPATYSELGSAMYNAFYRDDGLIIIRYPKGKEISYDNQVRGSEFDVIGSSSADKCVVTYGRVTSNVVEACKGKDTFVIKLNKIRPVPRRAVELACNSSSVYFVEECVRSGGIGEAFALELLESGFNGSYKLRAVNDCFIPHAEVSSQMKICGLDTESLKEFIS